MHFCKQSYWYSPESQILSDTLSFSNKELSQLSGNFSILALQFAFVLRDMFDLWLEPIAFDILCSGRLLTRKAQAHFAVSPSITVRFLIQYNLKITSVILFLIIYILPGLHAV